MEPSNQPTKHTPGPWLIADNDSCFVYALNAEGYNQFNFHVQGVHTSTAELEAVARVARAAPDLLEALKYARRMVNASECDIGFIDAAIAKAGAQTS